MLEAGQRRGAQRAPATAANQFPPVTAGRKVEAGPDRAGGREASGPVLAAGDVGKPITADEYSRGNQFTQSRHVLAELGQSSDRKPMVELNTFLGYNAWMSPAELRLLARKLFAIASDAEREPMGKRSFRRKYRRY